MLIWRSESDWNAAPSGFIPEIWFFKAELFSEILKPCSSVGVTDKSVDIRSTPLRQRWKKKKKAWLSLLQYFYHSTILSCNGYWVMVFVDRFPHEASIHKISPHFLKRTEMRAYLIVGLPDGELGLPCRFESHTSTVVNVSHDKVYITLLTSAYGQWNPGFIPRVARMDRVKSFEGVFRPLAPLACIGSAFPANIRS